MKLVSCVTGEEIAIGRILHGQLGPTAGKAWRFENIAPRPDGAHHIRVSRCGGRMGRIRGEFHPSFFGCEISIEVRWRENIRHTAYRLWARVDDYLWAGFFALVPLSFFEHFHWSEFVISVLGMDDH
ncbi:hypothetical protein [Streptomyces sp. NPDC094468]|uniref:hypothetical protein n=1 Tax=Streptomyces sp. NPDC094468 TaxID=3366066 RepID=UPI00381B2DBC